VMQVAVLKPWDNAADSENRVVCGSRTQEVL
jgi:hypothetical protein